MFKYSKYSNNSVRSTLAPKLYQTRWKTSGSCRWVSTASTVDSAEPAVEDTRGRNRAIKSGSLIS